MGILGVLNLVGSSSLPARSLAARRVPDVCVRRSAISPSSSPPPSPSPTGRAPSVVSCSSSSCCNDDPLADGYYDDSASDLSNAAPPPSGRRRGRHARRTVGRARTETEAERQGVLTGLISSALRRLLGERTRADASVGTGMMAKVISAPDATSRFLFCVVGPHSVDLATLWYSPDGQPLCSCWGHTQNVALLSMTGDTSTCWHAKSFQAAVVNLASYRTDIMTFLQVRGGTRPYGIDVKTHTGMAAAAFDGSIFSPVVATRRRDVKCVAVSCRANPRRCHHAQLVKGLGRLAVTTEVDDDVSDIMSDDDTPGMDQDSDGVDGVDDVADEELVKISKERQPRNLLACEEEDKQCLKWARTAEWCAEDLAASPFLPPPRTTGNVGIVGTEAPSEPLTFLQRMAELGLVFDPGVTLHETTCSQCGASKPDGTQLMEEPGKLFCDGNSSQPLSVRACVLLLSGIILVSFFARSRFLVDRLVCSNAAVRELTHVFPHSQCIRSLCCPSVFCPLVCTGNVGMVDMPTGTHR